MPDTEIVLGLLLAVVVLTTIARRLHVAYPVLLVLGGLLLGFMPGLPQVKLSPNLVFLLFLPPLLYWESINVSYRELRANLRTIASLAIGLVLTTIAVVAVLVHSMIPGISWAAAIVLGTVVAPTDETAAAAIADRLGLPRRLLAIIEDESLLNDATSLVAYNVAVAAVVTGTFSPPIAAVEFVLAGVGGVAIGLAAGWFVGQVRRHLDDPPVESTISLLSGYAAYLPAAAFGLSGVLAVVTEGLYVGRRAPRAIASRSRLQGQEVWEIVNFLLNGLLFVLVGLQLHGILGRLSAYRPFTLVGYALGLGVTVVLLRILWVFLATYLPRRLFPRWAGGWPAAPWQETSIVAWTGMRGALSLAAALAIPLVTHAGKPFPDRDLIVFLTFAVILATLVVQGLTLPALISRLGVTADEGADQEEKAARLAAVQAGLERLDSLSKDGLTPGQISDLRKHLEAKGRLYSARPQTASGQAEIQRADRYEGARQAILDAERDAVIDLRDQGIISDEVLRRIQRDLDLEEVELDR